MVDLDLFYAKVKFGHIGFCIGISETRYYLETIADIGIKVGLSIQMNELMKLIEYQWLRSLFDIGQTLKDHSDIKKGPYLTFAKDHSDFKIKSCFSQKLLSHLDSNFI